MSISSKIRMALAGLTVVALVGGVMAASPAEAGKKKHHKKVKVHKGNSVKQVSKGGNATGGNGGAGGAGGHSGNVNNTGDVGGGGGGFVLQPVPGSNLRACAAAALAGFVGEDPPVVNGGAVIDALVPECFPSVSDFAGMQGCIVSSAAMMNDVLTQAELDACIAEFIPADSPVMILVPAPASSGSVFSGNAGNGAAGGNGGTATGGAGGNNTNTSTVTVTRDDHSIDAG